MARGSVAVATTAAVVEELDAQAASIYVVSIAVADGLAAAMAIWRNHTCETPAENSVAQPHTLELNDSKGGLAAGGC